MSVGVRGGERLRLAPTSVRLGIRTVVPCWPYEHAATNHGPLGRALRGVSGRRRTQPVA